MNVTSKVPVYSLFASVNSFEDEAFRVPVFSRFSKLCAGRMKRTYHLVLSTSIFSVPHTPAAIL